MAGAASSKDETVTSTAAHGAADMTRRMVCGGVAGMIAKVCSIMVYVKSMFWL